MSWSPKTVALWFGLLLAGAARLAGAAEIDPAGLDYFEKHVRPVLAAHCYQCHSAGAEKLKGNLLLDTAEGVRKGGEHGVVLFAGEPEKSKLIVAIRRNDPDLQMPPKEPLKPEEVKALETWVKMGAPDPRTGAAVAPAPRPAYDFDEARKFWSFQPVKDSPVPEVRDKTWPVSPIDAFLLAEMESRGLKPMPAADRRTLIRRATYDLTGLPPTPEEVQNFLADDSPSAFEKLIDRLLASPAYGEQWGRHWLDLVRYADTSGCNSDYPVPQAAKYRDYVIKAFNEDKPYDEFLREQIAGDLLPAKDNAEHAQHLIATGYLAIARRFGSRNAEFHLTIEDTIDNLGKSMLGLSVSCARCHDHKFDPIPNADYYALYGIFDSTKYAFPGTEIYKHTKDFVPLDTPEKAKALKEWETQIAEVDERIEKLTVEKAILESREKALAGKTLVDATATTAVAQAAEAQTAAAPQPAAVGSTRPGAAQMRAFLAASSLSGRTSEQVKVELADAKLLQQKLEFKKIDCERAYAVSEGKPHNAKIQRKGQPTDLGEEVPRGFLTILGGQKVSPGTAGSGRAELAQWIADPGNPLTARVMVNRLWQHHFGKGLVKTPNDFGVRGARPTHPALLDYLATRFISGGWSVKSIHRMLMLSRAYQMQSADNEANSAIDPPNDLYWRFNPRRLSAEEIRDTMLALGNSLDRTPAPPHPFPAASEWKYTQHNAFVADYPTNHRSVYLMQQRIRKQPFLAVFDGADTNATTADRPISTTAIQALFMMNDPFAHEQADKFAVRVGMAFTDEQGRIDYAYRLAFGRPPTADEVQIAQNYLHAANAKMQEADIPWDERNRRSLASYVRVLLSSNELVFVD